MRFVFKESILKLHKKRTDSENSNVIGFSWDFCSSVPRSRPIDDHARTTTPALHFPQRVGDHTSFGKTMGESMGFYGTFPAQPPPPEKKVGGAGFYFFSSPGSPQGANFSKLVVEPGKKIVKYQIVSNWDYLPLVKMKRHV